jgi:hypothetical protein
MILAIDFDGTCVTHEYPRVGRDIGAVPVLKKLTDAGHKLVLFTMRGDGSGLDDAIKWFKDNDIPLWGIQTNPEQEQWTSSPKAQADVYIDDAALGCPLIAASGYERAYVDWEAVEKELVKRGILKPEVIKHLLDSLAANAPKHWCMCPNPQMVARDMFATCAHCRGMDAYGANVERRGQKYFKKSLL